MSLDNMDVASDKKINSNKNDNNLSAVQPNM